MSSSETLEKRQYLSFSLAGSDYGLGILQVKEILQYETITRVPSMPPSVRGVINLRGSVVPVLDLAVKFGLPATAVTKRTCILVVEGAIDGQSTVMGIIADAVSEVLELAPGDVEPPPPFGTRIRADFLVGMGKVGRGFVLLLDLARVLSAGERELLAAAEPPADPRAAALELEPPAEAPPAP
ncbi:MAG: purine-binding chemotaxis protein CheW [Deltaproteobacteria bacterium]|nr:purine-binding chemotaxis protein CheW [Deltaproteobacteria bacterium]